MKGFIEKYSTSRNKEIKNGRSFVKIYGIRKKNAVSRGQDRKINDLIIKSNMLSFILHS